MRADRHAAVSVEIGGGGATVALIDIRGRILARTNAKTLWGRPALATLEPYVRAIETILSQATDIGVMVSGIGVSIPGTVDTENRRPLVIPSLPSLNGFPLCDLLETRYGFPACLHVDVNAALLGEQHFGAGKGFRRILYLTVNTVVGAAFVSDDTLEHIEQPSRPPQSSGERFRYTQYTGHSCHLLLSSSGPRCSCGKRGCINTFISLPAIQKMVQRALRRGDETSLAPRLLNHEYLSLQLLAEEAARGDSVALQVYKEFARWLTTATEKYCALFEPQMIILGGDMLSVGELLLPQVRDSLTRGERPAQVVPARLGADAVLCGAVTPHFAYPLAS